MQKGEGGVLERVDQHVTALRASGHSNPERYTYVDSATNIDMSSSRANAVRVEEIPIGERPTVDGVGGGIVPTHYVYRAVPAELRLPGTDPVYRTVWSSEVRHDIVSTDTLGKLGLDVFTVSAEGGQMYLSPSGMDPRDESTRIRCVRVGGLQAMPSSAAAASKVKAFSARSAPSSKVSMPPPPGLTAPGEQSRPTVEPAAVSADVNTAVPVDLGAEPPRVPKQQRRPVSYADFRQRLGNASHDETMHAAKRMGVRLIGADGHRGRLDRERATANQIATAARKVADPGIFPRARLTVITDTVGPMPLSTLNNRYLQTWIVKGQPGFIVVTCSPDKSAASSWIGFETFARERGVELLRDAIHQSVELVHDCGTEYLGEFLQQCQRAGFVQRSATPHKHRKFEAHPSEGANRRIEAQMRINLVGSRRRFEEWGMDARAYWDRAAVFGSRQIAVRSHSRDHDVKYDQAKRELPPPGFGAPGDVKVQGGDTSRKPPGGKQLADRSIPGLFVGVTPNHKCIMVLRDASIMITSDVGFPITEAPSGGSGDATSDDEWMAPIDAAFGAAQRTPRTVRTSQPGQDGVDSDFDIVSESNLTLSESNSIVVPVASVTSTDTGDTPTDTGTSPIAGAVDRGTATPTPAGVERKLDGEQARSGGTAGRVVTRSMQMSQTKNSGLFHNPANDTEPTFPDHEGKVVSIGDHVTVTTDGTEQHGIVTDIDISDHRTPGGEVRVDYADGTDDYEYYPLQHRRRAPMRKRFDAATHRALIGDWRKPVCLRLTAASPPRAPHPSVLPYLDDKGNVLPRYLDGSAVLPPAPPLPGPEARIVTPVTTAEALAQPEALFWLHSHIGELRGHLAPANRPPTFHYTTERPAGRRLHVKFVYKVKRRQDDTIEKFKSRAVIAGWWLKRGVHYEESYTGQSPWSDVRDLEALAVNLRLRVYETDLVQAFPFASMPPAPNGEPVIVEMPAGSKMFNAAGLELFAHADQAWYGHPAAGFALACKLCRVFTGRGLKHDEERCTVQMVQHPSQPVVFRAQYPPGHEWHGEIFWLHVSTDNLRTYTSCDAMQSTFMAWLDRNFEVTGGRIALQDQAPQTFNGVRFSYIRGGVQLDMPAYVAKLLDEVGLSHANPALTPMAQGTVLRLGEAPGTATEQLDVVERVNKVFHHQRSLNYSEIVTLYSHLVSSIGWIASKVAPILLYAHSMLCRVLSAPSVGAFKALKRVLRYLAGRPGIHVTYVPDREYDWRQGDWPIYSMQSDASYADDPDDRRSQGAHIGGFLNQAITTAESKKGHRVATSTDQSEAQHAGAACKQAEYKRNFLEFLGVPMGKPTTLKVDNYANYLRTSAPIRKWSPASKQLDVLEKYSVECIERKIIKLEHQPGNLPENPRPGMGFKVDVLTKIMPTAATDFYSRELHGPNLRKEEAGRG